MITAEQYFRGKAHTAEHAAAFAELSLRVEALIEEAVQAGAFKRTVCPNTGSEISGAPGGAGDGGFRLPDAATGKPSSSHKEARGIDVYDPRETLDMWLENFEAADGSGYNSMLAKHNLYREHPDHTKGWCHLTTRPPRSGKRTFLP